MRVVFPVFVNPWVTSVLVLLLGKLRSEMFVKRKREMEL